MPGTDERKRHELYLAFEDLLGPDKTDTLMGLLPPTGTELATRQDVALTRAELRTEMAELGSEMGELRTELKTEMAELRGEFQELRASSTSCGPTSPPQCVSRPAHCCSAWSAR